ncbi:MAG TPA: hypothetical protein VF142_21655 [Longimicrobium sp.]
MRPSQLVLLAVLALHAACAPSPGRVGGVPPVQGPCRLPSYGALVLPEADLGMAPGESRVLAPPVAHHGPQGPRPLPADCPVTWSLEGTGGALDGAGRLTVAPDARVGDSLSVVARAMERSARARVLFVAPGPNPLAGTWRQVQTPNCVGYQGLIGELVLRRSGGMLLTVRPFETYVDMAGTYAHDPATGLLGLRSSTRAVDDGLFLVARARVEGDSLRLTMEPGGDRVGLFAAMPGDAGCTAVFLRAGGAP